MIRCNNCGWYNDDTLTVCEKCGEPLSVSSASPAPSHNAFSKTVRRGAEEESDPKPKSFKATRRNVSRTLKDEEAEAPQAPPVADVCPKCHYPLYPGAHVCPNCGTQIQSPAPAEPEPAPVEPAPEVQPAPQHSQFKATVREFKPISQESPSRTKPDFSSEAAPSKPVKVESKFSGKATIRDIPEELKRNEPETQAGPRLVPLDGTAPIIYLSGDSIVVVNGHQYRFVG